MSDKDSVMINDDDARTQRAAELKRKATAKQDTDPENYDPSLEPEEGDELASDCFPCTMEDDVFYKFKLRQRTDKDSDNFDIGANASQEEAAESTDTLEKMGFDCVLNHRLQPAGTISSAKRFKAYFMTYLKELKEVMPTLKRYKKEGGGVDEDKVKDHLKKMVAKFRLLQEDFDNLEIFSGEHFNLQGSLLVVHWEDGSVPYGYLAIDGLTEEKQ